MDDPKPAETSSPATRFFKAATEIVKSVTGLVIAIGALVAAVVGLLVANPGLLGFLKEEPPVEISGSRQDDLRDSPGTAVNDPAPQLPASNAAGGVPAPVQTQVVQIWSDQRIWASNSVQVNETETTILVTSIEPQSCRITVRNPTVGDESFSLSVGDVVPIPSEFETRVMLNRISRTGGLGPRRCHLALERDEPV